MTCLLITTSLNLWLNLPLVKQCLLLMCQALKMRQDYAQRNCCVYLLLISVNVVNGLYLSLKLEKYAQLKKKKVAALIDHPGCSSPAILTQGNRDISPFCFQGLFLFSPGMAVRWILGNTQIVTCIWKVRGEGIAHNVKYSWGATTQVTLLNALLQIKASVFTQMLPKHQALALVAIGHLCCFYFLNNITLLRRNLCHFMVLVILV